MSLYCMCQARNGKLDSQVFMAPNRFCALDSTVGGVSEVDDFPPLALRTKMVCIKTGARQVLLEAGVGNDWVSPRPSDWRNHYPNVDVFQCPHCGAMVAKG